MQCMQTTAVVSWWLHIVIATQASRYVLQMKGESKAAAELIALSQLINQVCSAAWALSVDARHWTAPHVSRRLVLHTMAEHSSWNSRRVTVYHVTLHRKLQQHVTTVQYGIEAPLFLQSEQSIGKVA